MSTIDPKPSSIVATKTARPSREVAQVIQVSEAFEPFVDAASASLAVRLPLLSRIVGGRIYRLGEAWDH